MNAASMADFVGVFLGFVFTLLIFSYILGDNPLFRLASHIFIGVSAGYVTIITIYNVLIPKLLSPLIFGSNEEKYLSMAMFILSLFLFAKLTPLKQAGNWVMAILVGIGAAAAVGGAVTGTLLPQILGTINSFDTNNLSVNSPNTWIYFLNGGIIVLGTATTLVYFHFGTKSKPGHAPQRSSFIDGLGKIGQVFIATTFAVLFTGVYFASLTALIERLSFLWDFILNLLANG